MDATRITDIGADENSALQPSNRVRAPGTNRRFFEFTPHRTETKEHSKMIRLAIVFCAAAGIYSVIPAAGDEVGVGIGPAGVTVHGDRDRDHDKTVIINQDRDRDRDKTVVINKDRDHDGDKDKTVIIHKDHD